jgi:hypothetical protein
VIRKAAGIDTGHLLRGSGGVVDIVRLDPARVHRELKRRSTLYIRKFIS